LLLGGELAGLGIARDAIRARGRLLGRRLRGRLGRSLTLPTEGGLDGFDGKLAQLT
jgi:hypothetical protein